MLLRLFAALLFIALVLIFVAARFRGLPFIGVLPGDFEINVPGFSLYIPLATSTFFALLLTVVAFIVNELSNKEE